MLTLGSLRTGITLVTGTDTDVGKSVATAVLASWLKCQGQGVMVCKPTQTGLAPGEPGDLAQVRRLARIPGDRLVEFSRLPEPLAPATAARRAGIVLPGVDELADRLVALSQDCDALLVEGAGGLLVGLDSQGRTIIDLADELTLRGHPPHVVLVIRAGLGTLNHTALSLAALAARGFDEAGLVIGSWPRHPGLTERCNAEELPAMAPVLATLPAGIGDDPAAVERSAAQLQPGRQNPAATGPGTAGTKASLNGLQGAR